MKWIARFSLTLCLTLALGVVGPAHVVTDHHAPEEERPSEGAAHHAQASGHAHGHHHGHSHAPAPGEHDSEPNESDHGHAHSVLDHTSYRHDGQQSLTLLRIASIACDDPIRCVIAGSERLDTAELPFYPSISPPGDLAPRGPPYAA